MGGHFAEIGVGVVEEGAHGLVGCGVAACAEVFGLQLSAPRAVGASHPTVLTVEHRVFGEVVEVASGHGLSRYTEGKSDDGKEKDCFFHEVVVLLVRECRHIVTAFSICLGFVF